MLEHKEKRNHQSNKNPPKGCFQIDRLHHYVQVKQFLEIKDVHNIVVPFRYEYFCFVILRKKDNVEGSIFELYHSISKKKYLRAVSKTGQIGSKYIIYCCETGKIVAKVRGDLLSSKFYLFDGGNNPVKKQFPYRKELAYIYFTNNEFFSQKPSNLVAILANHGKRVADEQQVQSLGTLFEAEGILQIDQGTSQLLKAEKQNSKQVFSLNSVQPTFCPNKNGYVIDLKGLVTEPSPVNLVMKTSSNQECFILGKRSQNTFSMYIGCPLTLIQGFGIFLANYDAKGSQ